MVINMRDSLISFPVIGVGGESGRVVEYIRKQGLVADYYICGMYTTEMLELPIEKKILFRTENLITGQNILYVQKGVTKQIDTIKTIFQISTGTIVCVVCLGDIGIDCIKTLICKAKAENLVVIVAAILPFYFEGEKKRLSAELALAQLRKYTDSLLVIDYEILNNKFNLLKSENHAFKQVDKYLCQIIRDLVGVFSPCYWSWGYDNSDLNNIIFGIEPKSMIYLCGSGSCKRMWKSFESMMNSSLSEDLSLDNIISILLILQYNPACKISLKDMDVIHNFFSQLESVSIPLWGIQQVENLKDEVRMFAFVKVK